MKKIYPIDDNYQGVVDIYSPAVFVYIEKKYKTFFRLIPRTKTVGEVVGYELGLKEDDKFANQMCAEYVPFSLSHVFLTYSNIHDFDPEVVIARLWHSYMERKNLKALEEKLISNKFLS